LTYGFPFASRIGGFMLNTVQLLDLAKSRHDCSDYKLSFLLEVVPSAVKNYRSGRSHPDDRVVRKLAELTDLDAGQIAIWMQAERARDAESRELWTEIARRFEGLPTTALALFLALFISHHPDAGAAVQSEKSEQVLTVKANEYEVLRESVYYVNRRGGKKGKSAWCSPLFSMHQMA
jgi:hypothetical protein